MELSDTDREGRGPNTPAESLPSAIQLLQQVRDRLGFGAASRETVAEALGYRTVNGTSRRKIAALSHFELLARNGSVYRISELGKQILVPRDEAEHRLALAMAARKPALYQKLVARYEGHPIPAMLPNILVREFGILPQTSEDVSRTFRETMEFAGLLRNGLLLTEAEFLAARTVDGQAHGMPPNLTTTTEFGLDAREGDGRRSGALAQGQRYLQTYTIPLDSQGSLATVEMPIPLTERNLRKIGAWVTYMLSVVQDQEQDDVSV